MAEQSLLSSERWLQLHGLKSKKLTLKQILSQIGFPQSEDYVTSLRRLVASRYADGLFPQIYTAEDGRLYNVSHRSLSPTERGCGHIKISGAKWWRYTPLIPALRRQRQGNL